MSEVYKQPRVWFLAAVAAVALVLVYQIWLWEVERVEVPPGKFLVLIHRWGKNLAEDQIIAPDDSYKGVMRETLAEGRHFINPIFWSHEVHDMVRVPVGKCLVLTSKAGKPMPQGQVLAEDGRDGNPARPC